MDTVDIIGSVPVQCRFVVLPSRELLLYVLTTNVNKPLVVYKYRGMEGFQEIASVENIFSSTNGLELDNANFELMTDATDTRQMIALKIGVKIVIIESVLA